MPTSYPSRIVFHIFFVVKLFCCFLKKTIKKADNGRCQQRTNLTYKIYKDYRGHVVIQNVLQIKDTCRKTTSNINSSYRVHTRST